MGLIPERLRGQALFGLGAVGRRRPVGSGRGLPVHIRLAGEDSLARRKQQSI